METPKCYKNYAFLKKMFQTKVVGFQVLRMQSA